MGRQTVLRTLVALVALLLVGGLASPALAGVGEYRCADPNKVYFGNARLFLKPCEIDSDKVYKHIPSTRRSSTRG